MENKEISGLAIASMVCGIFSIVTCMGPLLGIPAVIMGFVALGHVRNDLAKGKGLAIAGMVTGIIGSILIVVFFVLMIWRAFSTMGPALHQARRSARRISCASNLKQIGLALKMYSMNHNDMLPPSGVKGLNVLIEQEYLTDPNVYVCPNSKTNPSPFGGRLTDASCSYVFVGGFNEADLPADMPIAYDKDGNHDGGYTNILFLDGHVKGYATVPQVQKKLEYQKKCLKEYREKKAGRSSSGAADVSQISPIDEDWRKLMKNFPRRGGAPKTLKDLNSKIDLLEAFLNKYQDNHPEDKHVKDVEKRLYALENMKEMYKE